MYKSKSKWKLVIEVPPSGKPEWSGGAFTMAFVYSNTGNFVVKGFYREVHEYLKERKNKGLKFFANLSLWSIHGHRDIWTFYKEGISIVSPKSLRRRQHTKDKWEFYKRTGYLTGSVEVLLRFKRMPKKWIAELDKL